MGEVIPGNQLMYVIPSISFCSIPLSQIYEHAEWYGHYAIGVKPGFVKNNGGTPVVCVHGREHRVRSLAGWPKGAVVS